MNLADIDTTNPHSCPDPSKPVRVALAGDVRWATRETWQEEADALVAAHPNDGVPDVYDTSAPTKTVEKLAAPEPKPPIENIAGGSHDVIGEARSVAAFEAMVGAGFAPAQTVFRRGTRVIDLGVENARRSREEHDALPSVASACADFEQQIENERRDTMIVDVARTRMTKGGSIAVMRGADDPLRFQITPNAFSSLVGYHTGIGGGSYLAKCWPELRAINYNNWIRAIEQSEIAQRNQLEGEAAEKWEPSRMAFRTRNAKPPKSDPKLTREIFGVVSPSYTPFDVNKVAEALAIAMPGDARCRIAYDGRRATFDVQFHSNVQPKHYVAGEFFKAGIRVRTDDTGGGSLVGSAIVFQNLCLNLIIIDEQTQPLFRLRHVGSVETLAKSFRDGIQKGLGKLEHFLRAWDYAVEENIMKSLVTEDDVELPTRIEDALPGIFNGIIERELVPVRGQRRPAVDGLVAMWNKDTSFAAGATRGAIVNAFTRYAHEIEQDDFVGDEIERSVSGLLYGRNGGRPPRLPYLPMAAAGT